MNNIKPTELNEAPASVTYSIESKDGFNALFTIRELNGLDLLEKMKVIEKKLLEEEYKPQVKGFPKKEKVFVEGRTCPRCKGKVEEKITKTGKKFFKCENGKWNPQTQSAYGCMWTEWENEFAKDIYENEKETKEN